jgi:hypothetical protein
MAFVSYGLVLVRVRVRGPELRVQGRAYNMPWHGQGFIAQCGGAAAVISAAQDSGGCGCAGRREWVLVRWLGDVPFFW